MRRLAALTMMGLAFSACAGGARLDKADAPQTGQTASTAGSPDSSQPVAGTSDEGRADFGLADVAAALGVATPSTPGGTPAAPGGDPGGTPATGGSVLPGGLPNAGTPLAPGGATAAAPAPSGGADPGPGSGGAAPGGAPASGGSGSGNAASGSARPKIAATPEECALLRQLMAIVDHPQLHQLKADTGC